MDLTLNIERIKIIALYSSKGHKRISRMIMDKLSSQGNIVLELHSDDDDRVIFKKIDLADELFIIEGGLNDKEYKKIVGYAEMNGKAIKLLTQTPLSDLINEYRNIKKKLRDIKKDIVNYRANLEEAIEKGDAERIKYYSEQLRKNIIKHNDLRKRYHKVKGEIVETYL